jgi:putative ABC transport system permease protein
VLAYLLNQRSRELGVRIALGGTSQHVFQLVLRERLVLMAIGLALGLGGAFALRRVIESQIYGVPTMDPFLVASVATLLASIAIAASLLPALRATRLDPATILNEK